MNKRIISLGIIVFIGLLMLISSYDEYPAIAQQNEQTFSYGETVGGRFENLQQEIWTFEVKPRELFSLHVQRIGGEFNPTIAVSYQGNIITPDEETLTAYGQTLVFTAGQHTGGTYEVAVSGEISEFVDKINEYSLTLDYIGLRRENYDEDLVPLPKNGINDFPELYEGTRRPTASDGNENLNITTYGQGRIWRPDSRQFRNNWQIQAGNYNIQLNNAEPINRLIESISFLENGFGLTTLQTSTQTPAQIFIDQSITEFTVARSTLSLTLANGMQIVTDLYRIKELQVIDGMVIVVTTEGQRLILKGQSFEFTRKGGLQGQGPNIEPINVFKVNGQVITTDLVGWHTLFYDPVAPELRVIYSNDLRFISSVGTIGLFMRGNNRTCDDRTTLPVTQIDIFVGGDCEKFDWRFEISPHLMGDFVLNPENLVIKTLDHRVISDQVNQINAVLTENGAIYIARKNNTYRLSLPDHTDIETPAERPSLTDALPNHPQHSPRFFNNLGQTVFDYEPSFDFLGFTMPYNRVNGNFYYAVEDVNLSSHAPSLTWERVYNSLSLDTLTPDYYHSSRLPYRFGNIGNRWRHSYQYELDIRYVPLGDVWLILPDGSRHIFRVTDNPNVFRSNRMLSWQIEREGGLTGNWVIRRSNGWRYEFDRAGRLQRIADANGLDLTFSLAPRDQVERETATAGFFVMEHYGRRLEAYTDADQQVILVRQQHEHRYFYDDYGNQVRVMYPSLEDNLPDAEPNYHYNDAHQLVEIQDRLSPYHHAMRLDYADDGRLVEWSEAINSNSILTTQIRYDTRQVEEVIVKDDDTPHITRWLWDTNLRPTEIQYVDSNQTWTQGFIYDDASALQVNYRHFNRTQTRFRYDAYGYLTEVNDPALNRYGLSYQIGRDGIRRLLSEVSYPIQGNNTYRERYEYDENERVSRVIVPMDSNRSLVKRYEYDELGRVIAIYTPDPVDAQGEIITAYSYDRFGYIEQIEVYPTLRPDSGRRVLLSEFNNDGRLRKITDWSGVPIAIDWNEERNLITHINYGELANIAKALEYQYDDLRRLTQQTIQGQDEFFVYNDRNQLETYTDGLGRTTTYRYDVMGNVVEIVEPNSSTTGDEQRAFYNDQIYRYRYNAINQLIYSEYPGNIAYHYNYQVAQEAGTMTYEVVTPVGERLIYAYDVLGRLQNITNQDRYNRDSYRYRISYAPNGEVTRVEEVHDGSARFLTIDYDYRGYPIKTAIKDASTHYTYNHAGLISTITTPDGAQTSFTYQDDHIIVTLPDNDNNPSTPAPQYIYYYDENDNLTTWVDALGYETNYIYDSLNRVITVQDALGNITSYEYDERDNLTQLTDPNELSYTSIYSESDQLIERIMPDQMQTTFIYDNIDRLTEIKSPAYTIRYTYDIQGRVIARDITNRQSLFSYDGLGRISSTTDGLGRTTRYFYNNFNRLSQIIDSLGNTREYLWFRDGRLAYYKDPVNNQYDYISDELGRLSQINLPGGRERIRLEYSTGGNLTAVRRLDGSADHSYRYTYYPNGEIASITLPSARDNQSWRMQYNEMGQLTHFTQPDQHSILYEYDPLGRVINVRYPDETVENYNYDAVGNITSHTTRSGITHVYRYDNMRRVSEHTQQIGDQTITYLYRYSDTSPQIVVNDPYQRTQDYHFDTMGNLIQVVYHIPALEDGEEAHQIIYNYKYDLANNLISIVFPSVQLAGTPVEPTVNMTYNALNQRVRYVDATANSWAYSYDALGNLSQISDPLGNSTNYQYDSLNRLTSVQFSNRMVAEMSYNTGGNSFSVTDRRLEENIQLYPVIYEFDLNGNLIKIDPGGSNSNTITFAYDVMGRLLEMVNANRDRFTYSYDAMGNLSQVQGPDFNSQRTYDTLNNLTQITQNNQTLNFERDPLGQLIRYQGEQVNASYEYDLLGNLIRYERTDVDGEYQYDSLYRLIESSHNHERVEYVYNDIGWLMSQQYENGLFIQYDYYPNARPHIIRVVDNNGLILRLSYTYDDFGNVLRLEQHDSRGIRRVVFYSYDGMHQLINEQWLNENNEVIYGKNYRYDSVGNRVESITLLPNQPAYRVLYEYNAQNQLEKEFRGVPSDTIQRDTNEVRRDTSQAQLLTYSYDRAGNLIKVNDLNYSYDSLGRLTGVSGTDAHGNSVNTRFSYDGAGRVSRTSIGDEIFTLLYDDKNLVGIHDGQNQIVENFVYDALGNLLWKQTSDGKFYPITDALGTIRMWVDENGRSVNETQGYNFNGFGEVIFPYGEANATPINQQPQILFAGQLYEPNSNIYLMGVRAYSPEQGRFIQRDPVRHDPQGTLYTYAYNRPTDLFDPLGTTPNPAWDTAFKAPNIPTANIRPLIFSPVTETTVDTTTVAQAQAQENIRLLGVVHQLRYVLNDFIFLNDPYHCDVSYLGVKDPSSVLREQAGAYMTDHLGLYNTQHGWANFNPPNPLDKVDVSNILNVTNQLVRQAMTNGSVLSGQGCDLVVEMPQTAFVHPQTEQDVRQQIFDQIQEISLYPMVVSQLDELTQVPQIPLPAVPIPSDSKNAITPVDAEFIGILGIIQSQTQNAVFNTMYPLVTTMTVERDYKTYQLLVDIPQVIDATRLDN